MKRTILLVVASPTLHGAGPEAAVVDQPDAFKAHAGMIVMRGACTRHAPLRCSHSRQAAARGYDAYCTLTPMKEDVLEQIVDDHLKFNGYFTTHNVAFKPRSDHPTAEQPAIPAAS